MFCACYEERLFVLCEEALVVEESDFLEWAMRFGGNFVRDTPCCASSKFSGFSFASCQFSPYRNVRTNGTRVEYSSLSIEIV